MNLRQIAAQASQHPAPVFDRHIPSTELEEEQQVLSLNLRAFAQRANMLPSEAASIFDGAVSQTPTDRLEFFQDAVDELSAAPIEKLNSLAFAEEDAACRAFLCGLIDDRSSSSKSKRKGR